MNDTDNWRSAALCGADPDPWFPEEVRPQSAKQLAIAAAKAACRRCPVRRQCGVEALRLETGQPAEMRAGVFGAMTPEERAAADPIVQARKQVAA
jgi:WhiB family redox-sensing transcriptional regulator